MGKSVENEFAEYPGLTDGVIFLRPLTAEDAANHLAGEDDEMARWVSGGWSTLSTVEAFIRKNQESWQSGGPRRAFGVFDCASNRVIGFIEVNLARLVEPGQVNVSYGVFPQWRRRGLALRAITSWRNIYGQQRKPARWSSESRLRTMHRSSWPKKLASLFTAFSTSLRAAWHATSGISSLDGWRCLACELRTYCRDPETTSRFIIPRCNLIRLQSFRG